MEVTNKHVLNVAERDVLLNGKSLIAIMIFSL